jgi:[ribosomal protein S18]-alanine N-acetyltransferase
MLIKIDYAVRDHVPAFVDIENATQKVKSARWDEKDFFIEAGEDNVVVKSALDGSEPVGFIVYHTRKSGYEILHMAVHPAWQRHGIGTRMVEALKESVSRSTTKKTILVVVRESNLQAQMFFKKLVFMATKVERNYYLDTNEAGYVFKFTKSVPEVEAGKEVATSTPK